MQTLITPRGCHNIRYAVPHATCLTSKNEHAHADLHLYWTFLFHRERRARKAPIKTPSGLGSGQTACVANGGRHLMAGKEVTRRPKAVPIPGSRPRPLAPVRPRLAPTQSGSQGGANSTWRRLSWARAYRAISFKEEPHENPSKVRRITIAIKNSSDTPTLGIGCRLRIAP